jgi:hypothetical protein
MMFGFCTADAAAVAASTELQQAHMASRVAATGRRIRFPRKIVSYDANRLSFFHESARGVANFWLGFHTILSGELFAIGVVSDRAGALLNHLRLLLVAG